MVPASVVSLSKRDGSLELALSAEGLGSERSARLAARLFGTTRALLTECVPVRESAELQHLTARVSQAPDWEGASVEIVLFKEHDGAGFVMQAAAPETLDLGACLRRIASEHDPDDDVDLPPPPPYERDADDLDDADGDLFSGLAACAETTLCVSTGRGGEGGDLALAASSSDLPSALARGVFVKLDASQMVKQLGTFGIDLGMPEKADLRLQTGDAGAMAVFDIPLAAKLELGGANLTLEFEQLTLSAPVQGAETEADSLLLAGHIKAWEATLAWHAALDLRRNELRIGFRDFPTLEQVLGSLTQNSAEVFRNGALHDLLSIRVSFFEVVVDLQAHAITEVSVELTHGNAIQLCGNVIKVKPDLAMAVIAPFDETREITGRISGAWEVGPSASFETTLYLPDLTFLCEMNPGSRLSVADLATAFDWDLPLDGDPALSAVAISGDAESFDAALTVDPAGALSFNVGGECFRVTGLSLGATVMGADLAAFRIEGAFTIGAVSLELSGAYLKGEGWSLQAATASGSELPVGQIAETLLGGVTLPGKLGGLALTDVALAAEPGAGSYSLLARMPRKWEITKNISVDIDEFRIEKPSENSGLLVCLGLRLDICETTMVLRAEKGATDGKGWVFAGGLAADDHLSIAAVKDQIETWFTLKGQIPEILDKFKLDRLDLKYNADSGAFDFTLAGQFDTGADTPLKASVEIHVVPKGSNCYGGTLEYGGVTFKLDFESGKEKKALKAEFKQAQGQSPLALSKIAESYGLSNPEALEVLPDVQKATLNLTLGESARQVKLNCEIDDGKGATFQAWTSGQDGWSCALAVALPGASVGDFGELGAIIDPHRLALDNLFIAYASQTPDPALAIPGEPEGVQKGLTLRGRFTVTETDIDLPFECRLGGVAQDPQSATQEKPQTATDLEPKKAEAGTEAKNTGEVGRKIGPVTLRKTRFEKRGDRVCVMLDASLGASVFTLDLDGLNASLPLSSLIARKPEGFAIGLDGLGIDVVTPTVKVAGGLIREPAGGFSGDILVKASKFQISAFGAYSVLDLDGGQSAPSLYLYGAFVGALGGPPAFFITGVALGGGYNSRLETPCIDGVAGYPLIAAVTGSSSSSAIRAELKNYITPSTGDYWGAIGVSFNSFKLADSFALLTVAFGNRLRFALLGLSRISQPEGASAPTFSVSLALRAVLDPEAGILSVEGTLTEGSYVFTRKLALGGDFAFYVWFGGAHAGDFVVSVGGYHPSFNRPAHYPELARVSLGGCLSSNLKVLGKAYFAITPSCMMGGVRFEAVFNVPTLRAAFLAYADFIVAWAPFSYDVRIGISISLIFNAFEHTVTATSSGIKAQLSADLHIWGPSFAGVAKVSFWCVSFTVKFGDLGAVAEKTISWGDLCTRFLPAIKDAAGTEHTQFGSVTLTGGMVRDIRNADGDVTETVVNAHELAIETESTVPCTEMRFCGAVEATGPGMGVLPLGHQKLRSVHSVDVLEESGTQVTDRFMLVSTARKNFPRALWSASPVSKHDKEQMITDVPAGVLLRTRPTTPDGGLRSFQIESFKYCDIAKSIRFVDAKSLSRARAGEWPEVSKLLSEPAQQAKVRDAWADLLGALDIAVPAPVTLSGALSDALQAAPAIGPVGSAP